MKNPGDPSDNSEEEFHFSEENESTQKFTASSNNQSIVSNTEDEKVKRRKAAIILVGLILGIFCIYKLYGLFTATSAYTLKAPLSGPKFESVKAGPGLVQQSAALPSVNNMNTVSQEENALAGKVAGLGRSQENIQNEITGLSSAMTEIQNNIAVLTQKMSDVIAAQKEQTAQKTPIKQTDHSKVINHHKNSSRQKYFPQKIKSYNIYYIKSLIQGRAWLTTQHGATLTVSVGQILPGYGSIKNIDTDNGIVTTSSGKVIGYMSHDR